MYDTIDEYQQKLSGCILLYNDSPIYVYGALTTDTPGIKLKIAYCESLSTADYIDANDVNLNYRELGNRLGYINLKSFLGLPFNECSYMMRIPIRSSTHAQGLSKKNVRMSPLKGNASLGLNEQDISFDESVYKGKVKDFKNTLNGVYPTIKGCMKDFEKDPNVVSRAFSRTWAVERDEVGPFNLMYKNTRVGYTEDFEKFTISNRYKFLRHEFFKLKEAA